ncbi:hypothetical protein J6590_067148 [Homalodisca vitripennis]|nr:hypothetical protein J6590_067148 [Homalodisca vitripennis]
MRGNTSEKLFKRTVTPWTASLTEAAIRNEAGSAAVNDEGKRTEACLTQRSLSHSHSVPKSYLHFFV